MRYLALLLAGTALFGCSWETYQKTTATPACARNTKKAPACITKTALIHAICNTTNTAPESHAVKPGMSEPAEVRGANWDEPQSSAQ